MIGSILGSNEGYIYGTLVGLALGDTYVAPLGSFVDHSDSVRVGEDMGMIYENIRGINIGGA